MPKKVSSKLHADTIILGFSGSIGSGCTYLAEGIGSQYKYKYLCLSDILKEIAHKQGLSNPTVKELQELGNTLRAKNGNGFLIEQLLKTIEKNSLLKNSFSGIIIDSIRNDFEVKTLRQFPFFYLFSIHADEKIRLDRTLKMGKFKDEQEFYLADSHDRAEDMLYGQQVRKCNDLSDIIINNQNNIPKTATKAKKEFIDELYNKYILLIEQKKKGLLTSDNLPSVDETLMTMAYAESHRSFCLKRKVGAIIASIYTTPQKNNFDKSINEAIHVISSGHNEVPFGTVPCIFNPGYEKCYRDYLQEEQAKKINNCPNCGEKINLPAIKCKGCNNEYSAYLKVCPKCKDELEVKYICPKCNSEVFKEYLLGGGKLLDMCRSLHAEENALLNLIKSGSNNSRDLVLYTTLYPCNLCANKIVAAGIKKIVYADPYPMKEAKNILDSGDVKVDKFQGIKSSAFFRLYR